MVLGHILLGFPAQYCVNHEGKVYESVSPRCGLGTRGFAVFCKKFVAAELNVQISGADSIPYLADVVRSALSYNHPLNLFAHLSLGAVITAKVYVDYNVRGLGYFFDN